MLWENVLKDYKITDTNRFKNCHEKCLLERAKRLVIYYRGEGGYKMGKLRSGTFLPPPAKTG